MSKLMVYVTKYALTSGIQYVEAERTSNENMVVVKNPGELVQYLHGEGRDFHISRDGAIAKAELMRKAKIKSLRKSIAKLEAASFEEYAP